MGFWKKGVLSTIEKNDPLGLDKLLSINPDLANKGIAIPFEFFCRTYAHPLHRLCDAVFSKRLPDSDAVELARILVKHGSRIEGNRFTNQEDPPILAAASLHAEQVGLFLLDQGADPNVESEDGSTALHWAAFCGRDKLVQALISRGVKIDLKDFEHQSTPLKWAIHCLTSKDSGNLSNQFECIRLLLDAGANIDLLDPESIDFLRSSVVKHSFLSNYLH